MKEFIDLFKNWRVVALMTVFIFATILILGEANDLSVLILTKIIGFTLIYACIVLHNTWNRKGKIDELKNYFNQLDKL